MSETSPQNAIAIGGSAGALEALSLILPALPGDFPCPVFIVVHLPPDKYNAFPELLSAKCKLRVREAEDKEPARAGMVYMAPPDYHLLVEPDHRLSLSSEEPVLFSRPSIDVMFESAADAYGDGLTGVVLSGGNDDGARGLKAIRAAGGKTVVQRIDSAWSRAMPEAALQACPGSPSFDPAGIAEYILQRVVQYA